MSKNFKSLVCCILALVFVAGTVIAVFADSASTGKYELSSDEVSTEEVSSTTTTYLMGDVNLDGKITAADARLALRCAARLEKLSDVQLILADVNNDGIILSNDARLILRVAARLDPSYGTVEI